MLTSVVAAVVVGLGSLASVSFADANADADSASAGGFSDGFEDGDTAGWAKSGGSWSVVSDGSKVLARTRTGATAARQFAGAADWADYQLQARVEKRSLAADGYAAIVARSTGATSFYRLALTGADKVRLESAKSGAVTVLGEAALTVRAGTSYLLGLKVNGGAHGKDFYDGMIDLTHATDFVTVSWNHLHDHFKGSLVGHSDNNAAEDTGHLRIAYGHNWFDNVGSRLPRVRFGTVHVDDNLFTDATTSGLHCLMNAQCLVQNNVFVNVKLPVWTTEDSDEDGFAVISGNDFGGAAPVITRTGTFTKAPYAVTLEDAPAVSSLVKTGAGAGRI